MNSWKEFIASESSKEYYQQLKQIVDADYEKEVIYPPKEHIFNAFKYCPLDKVKVVILGQDPYHGQGQAHGLSFSVNKGIPLPPSLRNIYLELDRKSTRLNSSHVRISYAVFCLKKKKKINKKQKIKKQIKTLTARLHLLSYIQNSLNDALCSSVSLVQ